MGALILILLYWTTQSQNNAPADSRPTPELEQPSPKQAPGLPATTPNHRLIPTQTTMQVTKSLEGIGHIQRPNIYRIRNICNSGTML